LRERDRVRGRIMNFNERERSVKRENGPRPADDKMSNPTYDKIY